MDINPAERQSSPTHLGEETNNINTKDYTEPVQLGAASCSHSDVLVGCIEEFDCGYCGKTVPLKALLLEAALHPEWPEKKLAIANHDHHVSLCSNECAVAFKQTYNSVQ